jgi:4-amino-4-deoxy-L-arabinose transferase-like glycosyltransferase
MKRYWLYALILLVPVALYTAGLDYGRPRPEYSPSTTQNAWLDPAAVYHPDAFAYVGIAYRMLVRGDWNPHYYHNPPVNIYTDMGFFWLSGALGMPHNKTYDDRSIAPFQLYVMAEYLSALYMLLTVVMAYAAGRIAFGRGAGRMAAGIVALSPLIVQHAHYATPNAQTTMISTAALLVALVIVRGRYAASRMWGVYIVGGLLVGLTMATRYNAVVVGMVTGLAMLTDGWRKRRWGPVAAGFAAMPVGLVIGLPGLVLVPSEVIDQVRDILTVYRNEGGGDGSTAGRGLASIFIHWRYTVLMVVGPVTTLAALLGLALTQCRWSSARWPEAWIGAVLAGYMLVYTVLALPGKRIQANLLFPLIVPLALLAGYGVVWLWRQTGRRRWVAAGLAAALLAWPALLSLLFVYRIVTPDNRARAQAWLYQHVPRGSSVHILEPYNVPVDPLDYRVSESFARQVEPEQLQETRVQVIVYSDAYPWIVLRDPALSSARGIARETAIRDILEAEWIKLASFKRMPWPGENLPPDDVSYWHQMGITIYCNPTNCPVDTGG